MAIAALYPLWGVLVGAVSVWLAEHAALSLAGLAAFIPVLLVSMGLAAVEAKLLRLPGGLHVLGAGILCGAWLSADPSHSLYLAIAIQAASRSTLIALAWVSRPAAGGLHLGAMRSWHAIVAILCGAVAVFSNGIRTGLLQSLAAYLIVRVLREWWYAKRGGATPTSLTLSQRAEEAAALLIGILVQ